MTEVKEERFIEPFYDRVVLELILEEKSRGGIVLPTSAQDTQRAKVVALGPGKYDMEKDRYLTPPMSVGDTVVINPRLGNKTKFRRGGKEYLIQGVEEIVGKEILL